MQVRETVTNEALVWTTADQEAMDQLAEKLRLCTDHGADGGAYQEPPPSYYYAEPHADPRVSTPPARHGATAPVQTRPRYEEPELYPTHYHAIDDPNERLESSTFWEKDHEIRSHRFPARPHVTAGHGRHEKTGRLTELRRSVRHAAGRIALVASFTTGVVMISEVLSKHLAS